MGMADIADEDTRSATPPLSAAEREAWARSYVSWDWINAHPEVLEQYRGQYIAVFDERVIASGPDHRSFRAALEMSPYGDEQVLLLRVPRHDEVDGLLVL